MCVFNITLKCIIVPWFLHENTIYCIFVVRLSSLLSQPAKLWNFAKLKFLQQNMSRFSPFEQVKKVASLERVQYQFVQYNMM